LLLRLVEAGLVDWTDNLTSFSMMKRSPASAVFLNAVIGGALLLFKIVFAVVGNPYTLALVPPLGCVSHTTNMRRSSFGYVDGGAHAM